MNSNDPNGTQANGSGRLTYRERRERRAERRRTWAGREGKADAAHQASHDATAGIPFGQPILVGHHSEGKHRRAIERSQRQATKAIEHSDMARRHRQAADTIDAQLDASIYDDDPDAIDRLRERIEQREAKRDRMKKANADYRKQHRAELKAMTPYERDRAVPAGIADAGRAGSSPRGLRARAAARGNDLRSATRPNVKQPAAVGGGGNATPAWPDQLAVRQQRDRFPGNGSAPIARMPTHS